MESKIEKKDKKYGIGTLSPVIAIAAIIFSHLYLRRVSVGTELLSYLKINISDEIITAVGIMLALFIGIKYNEHKFSKAGIVISLVFLLGGIILTIIACICSWIYG